MRITSEPFGFEQLQEYLRSLPNVTERRKSRVFGRVLKESLAPVVASIRRRTPVRTGRLRKSAGAAQLRRGRRLQNAVFGGWLTLKKRAPHGSLVEHGSRTRYKRGKMPAARIIASVDVSGLQLVARRKTKDALLRLAQQDRKTMLRRR